MNCKCCDKSLGKKSYKIKCAGDCQDWFHAGCTGLTDKVLGQVKSGKKTWTCESCSDIIRKSGNESSEEEAMSSESEDEEPKIIRKDAKTKKLKNKVTLEDIMKKLEDLLVENKNIHNKIDKYEKEMKLIKTQINELKEENNTLKKEIITLRQNKEVQEQDKLLNNVVVQGIPIENANNEDITTHLINIAKLVNVNLNKDEFKLQRLGKTIVKVKFTDFEKKKEIMVAKKNTIIKTSMIGFVEDKIIFLNHDMTRENQKLFKEARDFKKQENYKYVWFENGAIYLRKTEKSKIIQVVSSETLNNLSNPKN